MSGVVHYACRRQYFRSDSIKKIFKTFPEQPSTSRTLRSRHRELILKQIVFLCTKEYDEEAERKTNHIQSSPHLHKFLKKDAVPSIFSWNKTNPTPSARDARIKLRNENKEKLCIKQTTPGPKQGAETPENTNHSEVASSPYSQSAVDVIGSVVEVTSEKSPEKEEEASTSEKVQQVHANDAKKTSQNKSTKKQYENTSTQTCGEGNIEKHTQTSTLSRIFNSHWLTTDDESVLYYTGLETYTKFQFVLATLMPMAKELKYRWSNVIWLSIKDQFLMLLIKLRRNKADLELSKLFNVSKAEVSNILVTWINFVNDIWRLLDIWPSRELVNFYMPESFREKYPKTRVIIDGTEIPIQKPKNPDDQTATFSQYKHKNTMKFLVGCTPGGLLCYFSPGYAGSTSGLQIVERSELLDLNDT